MKMNGIRMEYDAKCELFLHLNRLSFSMLLSCILVLSFALPEMKKKKNTHTRVK